MLIKSIIISMGLMSSSFVVYETYPLLENFATKEDVDNINFDIYKRYNKDLNTLAEIQGIKPFDLQIEEIEDIKESGSVAEAIDKLNNVFNNFGIQLENKEENKAQEE